MISIDEILTFFERKTSYEREDSIAEFLETELKGKINLTSLQKELEDHYKNEYDYSLSDSDPKEIMDEFCDTFGFDELVYELNNRIQDG